MKKIILSVAVATMALSTVASALEDIKVSGQAKLWYETQDAGSYMSGNDAAGTKTDKNLLDAQSSTGEVVFKLGVTGKQGNVGFGTTIYQSSTMGLEGVVVGAVRTKNSSQMYVGEAYITAPLVASTIMKFGKQELDTPMAFTERWNAAPNTFNAAVLVNNSVDNLTLIAAYVGQSDNEGTWKRDNEVDDQYYGGAFAVAALYKTDAFGLNAWAYQINNVGGATTQRTITTPYLTHGGNSVNAYWLDATVKAGPVALKAYAAMVSTDQDAPTGTNNGHVGDSTTAVALSAGMKAGPVNLFLAGSTLTEGQYHVANTATGFKKTKLPTAGVYTDGVYVAAPASTAFKLKASGKAGSTGLALQAVMNTNSDDDRYTPTTSGKNIKDTTEIDLIITQKLGDFNFKAILLNRTFADSVTDKASGGNHFRVITSVNF